MHRSQPRPTSRPTKPGSHPYPYSPNGRHSLRRHSRVSSPDDTYTHPPSPSQSHLDRNPHHRAPSVDPYYYPPAPRRSYPSPEHRHRPPPPHPPAPPLPPSYRKTYQPRKVTHSPPSLSLVPAFNYYRPHANYDNKLSPSTSYSTPESSVAGSSHIDTERDRDARDDHERSGSTSSENADGERDIGQPPIDVRNVPQWPELAHETSQYTPSGSRSNPGEDGDEDGNESIDTYSNVHHGIPSIPLLQVESGGEAHVSEYGATALDTPYSQKRPNSQYYPSAHHQAQFRALAQQPDYLAIHRGNIGLNSLFDTDPGCRPGYPLPTIIKCAILGSPHQQLTLSELYIAMEARFEYYRNLHSQSWKNSVRHNLSLNNQFAKKERPITEPGKGNYWVVVPDMPQGNKRERKRNKKPGKRALAAEAARIAREQKESEEPNNSQSSNEMTLDPQLSDKPAAYATTVPPSQQTVTLSATAGSYAAVTGALPEPPQQFRRELLRRWDGHAWTIMQDHLQHSTECESEPVPSAPKNAFTELAARIAREGLGAAGSGGPAITASKKKRNAPSSWDSEEDEDDDHPRKTRRMS